MLGELTLKKYMYFRLRKIHKEQNSNNLAVKNTSETAILHSNRVNFQNPKSI